MIAAAILSLVLLAEPPVEHTPCWITLAADLAAEDAILIVCLEEAQDPEDIDWCRAFRDAGYAAAWERYLLCEAGSTE